MNQHSTLFYKTTTVTACLRTSGIVAPWLLDGAMNGSRFRTYVEQVLVPKLRPGDTLILENLSAHKVAGMRQRLAKIGAGLLYLPPYSPNFNPIEQAFAKLKGRCEQLLLAPSTTSTPPSTRRSSTSPQPSAGTTSRRPDTKTTWPFQNERMPL